MSTPDEHLVTVRTAQQMLADAGVGGASTVLDVLWSGLAGDEVWIRRRFYYRRECVEDVCNRPVVTPDSLTGVARSGVLLLRMRARHEAGEEDAREWIGFDARAHPEEQEEAFRGWWRPPRGGYRGLVERLELGPVPLVVTCGGVVGAVRDVTGVSPPSDGGRIRFDVAPAGDWAAAFCQWDKKANAPAEPFIGYRLRGPGGAPLMFWPSS